VQRLKTRSQFQAVLAGERVAHTTHFVLHRCELNHGDRPSPFGPVVLKDAQTVATMQDSWIGAMVPKRWAKRAVTRNTIRRQIYSVSSEQTTAGSGSAHVVRLRVGFDRGVFVSATSQALKKLVRQELTQLFAYAARREAKVPSRATS